MGRLGIALVALLLAPVSAVRAVLPPDATAVDPPEIRAALGRREFDPLEARLLAARERWKADHASPERERLVEAFRELSPQQAEALYAWNHERPRSAPARLALAAHYIGEAWRARGTRYARDTSSDQLARMRDYSIRAAGAAAEALALDPDWVDAHRLRMEAARLTSDRAGRARAFAAALELAPDDYAARWEHARGLTPRWGGSYEALDAFVAESQTHAATNPRLVLLLGRSDADRGEVLSADESYEEAVALLDRALRHGEEPSALSDRGWTLHRLERHPEARTDLERAVALEPDRAKHHSRLASVLVQLREFDRAVAEYEEAERLDSDEPYYRKRRLELQSWMVARKQHDQMQREKPVRYAAFRASHALLFHSAAVAGGSVVLWLGWQVWRRRRGTIGGGAAPEAARATASGVGRLLLQSYAWLLTLFHAYVYLWGALRGTRTEPEDHADLAITALALLGVLAFAHGRRAVVPDLWRAMAFAFPAWNLVYHFHLEGGAVALVGTWLPIHVFLLPAYVSLFLYGFRSESLWRQR
jgi:tetratricopeptide (TPR) repeat protein